MRSLPPAGRLIGLMFAIAVAAPAPAIPPPLPVHAAYGPLVQCFAGYRIAVSGAEAVVLGTGLVVNSGNSFFALDAEPAARPAGDKATTLEVPGIGTVGRYVVPSGRQRPGLRDAGPTTEYVLPPIGGAGAVLVRSPRFDGGSGDLATLARIGPAGDDCGTFGPPDYAGASAEALYWSPVRHDGPAFHCLNGIGFAVAAGEQYQRMWSDEGTRARLHGPAGEFALDVPPLPDRVRRKGGPVAAGFAQSVREDAAESHVLLLQAAPPRRGWSAENPEWASRLSIRYRPGTEAAAQAFAARLQFVDSDDRRCRAVTGKP